ncbi:MAG: CheR family methyltransferase [Acetobacteraceae bacterium]
MTTSHKGTVLSDAAFDSIATLLRSRAGLAIGPDQFYLMAIRLTPIARREGFRDIGALADRLTTPGSDQLMRDVIEAMTTNESLFFRDCLPFQHLRDEVLPRLQATRPPGLPLRIWSAAASTGQEAYSAAMTIAEYDVGNPSALNDRTIEIIGTDIARKPLSRASEGLYSTFEVQRGLPLHLRQRYFCQEGENWRISPKLRKAVEFREWNLLSELAPLGTFDVVFCRNVLLYFDGETKAKVLEAIAPQLAPDGVLYLGAAETVLGLTNRFAGVSGLPGVFRPA